MKHQRKHSRRRSRSSEKGKLLFWVVLVALLPVVIYLAGQWVDQAGKKPETRGQYIPGEMNAEIIQMDGVQYRKKAGLTTVLIMGIDRESTSVPSGYRNGGQADFLRLFVIDTKADTLTQIQIDRDTVTPITILGVMGDKAGVRNAQISLSHGFGDGGKQSCELTVEAVSNFLNGTSVDYYIAMTLDGIIALNDLVGGVTVTIQEDLTDADPALAEGATITLMGDQAEAFVRSRMAVGEGTNVERMERQEQYAKELFTILADHVREDKNYAGDLFDALKQYMTTDISRGRLVNLAWSCRNYERADVVSLPGTHQVGADGFMTFQVNESELQKIVLDVFYDRVE